MKLILSDALLRLTWQHKLKNSVKKLISSTDYADYTDSKRDRGQQDHSAGFKTPNTAVYTLAFFDLRNLRIRRFCASGHRSRRDNTLTAARLAFPQHDQADPGYDHCAAGKRAPIQILM